METKLKKIGGSICIIIPPDMLEYYKFKEDMWIDVDLSEIIKLRRVEKE